MERSIHLESCNRETTYGSTYRYTLKILANDYMSLNDWAELLKPKKEKETEPKDARKFNIGDVVMLKSGGPPATVTEVCWCEHKGKKRYEYKLAYFIGKEYVKCPKEDYSYLQEDALTAYVPKICENCGFEEYNEQ